MNISIKEIKELIKIVKDAEISEFTVETEGVKLNIKKSPAIVAMPAQQPQAAGLPYHIQPAAPAPAVQTPAAQPAQVQAAADDDEISEDHLLIAAPMVGTFYRAPAPEAPAYVEVGSTVKQGQPVCIIEAMKLMNEIESEISGRVIKILVENAQPVEYGQPLFVLEKI